MNKPFDLTEYLSLGVEKLVKDAIKASLLNPRQAAFIAKYAVDSRKAAVKRAALAAEGEHIPPFLIAGITESCNLHCKGCYARANGSCTDETSAPQLSCESWLKIFREAAELGISFILLAGGEPLIRKDVILAAGGLPQIVFPVFTNGTMLTPQYIELFDKHRNLIPILSIEGGELVTDTRRGKGIYKLLRGAMEHLSESKILFGASVTVTSDNLEEVFSDAYVIDLESSGCKLMFYVEYVPTGGNADDSALAPGDAQRTRMEQRLSQLRAAHDRMIFVSFPGDEKASAGCLAAGRGFFYINPSGGAEPCPFSPYSDINVSESSVREALHSKLFTRLQSADILTGEHSGGCVLFEKREQVEALLDN